MPSEIPHALMSSRNYSPVDRKGPFFSSSASCVRRRLTGEATPPKRAVRREIHNEVSWSPHLSYGCAYGGHAGLTVRGRRHPTTASPSNDLIPPFPNPKPHAPPRPAVSIRSPLWFFSPTTGGFGDRRGCCTEFMSALPFLRGTDALYPSGPAS